MREMVGDIVNEGGIKDEKAEIEKIGDQ
jgi:hypothetical protein